ncbi:hypothetical protein BGX34_005975 [Mortierella sp. NVP85]|nr:hypothetical protein BGX34_005975 [Mortierella sp. NVP85]
MAGPKLEIFKASDLNIECQCAPEFYDKHVRGSRFYPAPEEVNTRTGIDRKELLYEVERLKRERLARKAAREGLTDDKNV